MPYDMRTTCNLGPMCQDRTCLYLIGNTSIIFSQLLCPVQHLNWISIQINIGQGLIIVHAHNTLYLDD